MKDTATRQSALGSRSPINVGAVILVGALALSIAGMASCRPGGAGVTPKPAGIGFAMTRGGIKDMITSVDPNARFSAGGGASGGGGAGTTGGKFHGSYGICYQAIVTISVPLGVVVRALSAGITSEATRLGASIHGGGEGPVTRTTKFEKERVIRIYQSWIYTVRGFDGRMFLTVFPILDRPEAPVRYQIILQTVEVYVGK